MSSDLTVRPSIDEQAAKRIGYRMAKGLTMEQACVLESPPVDPTFFDRLCADQPMFRVILLRCEADYIEQRLDEIVEPPSVVAASSAKWILENTRPQQFGKKPSLVINQSKTYIAGVPNDVLDRMRAATRKAVKKANVIEVKDV